MIALGDTCYFCVPWLRNMSFSRAPSELDEASPQSRRQTRNPCLVSKITAKEKTYAGDLKRIDYRSETKYTVGSMRM